MSWSACRPFRAEEPPLSIGCNAAAQAPWHSAGEGYRAFAETTGSACSGADLVLTLNAPDGFEPEPGLDRDTYEAARAARHPLFCYGYAPRTETCVMLVSPREVMVLGRRLLQ